MKKLLWLVGLCLLCLNSAAFAGPGDPVMEGPDRSILLHGDPTVTVPGIFYVDITLKSPDGYDNAGLTTLFENQLPSGLTLYITGVSVFADDPAVNYDIWAGATQYARSKSGATIHIIQDGSTDSALGDVKYGDIHTGSTAVPANLPIYFGLTDTNDVPDEMTISILGYLVKE